MKHQKLINFILVAIIGTIAVLLAAGCTAKVASAPLTTPTVRAVPGAVRPATAPTTPTTTAAPIVLYQQSGQGQSSGPQFTVPSSVHGWNEVWSYDCSAFGQSGNFITSIHKYNADGSTSTFGSTDQGESELGAGRNGINHYYDHGVFSINVISECSWTEEAVTVP